MINIVEIFLHYLGQLQSIVVKVEQACDSDPEFLSERLHEDMLPFANQVRTAANFALRGVCPLLGREPISFAVNENSFAALYQQINATLRYLQEIDAELTLHALGENEKLKETAGFTEVCLPRDQFIHHYILPNFYFHLSMVYAIARSRGVSLSKQDFDGYHTYPDGFSFERSQASAS